MNKTKLLAVPLKIFTRRTHTKNAEVNAENECVTIIKQKRCKKFYAFDLIDNDVLQYNIVSALFSFFFKDLNLLSAVLFTISYRSPNSSYSNLCLAFSKFILKSY